MKRLEGEGGGMIRDWKGRRNDNEEIGEEGGIRMKRLEREEE